MQNEIFLKVFVFVQPSLNRGSVIFIDKTMGKCYVFLYIRLSFDGRFSVVPNHTIFVYQKK